MWKRAWSVVGICIAVPLLAESVPVPRITLPDVPQQRDAVTVNARGNAGPNLSFADARHGRKDFDFAKLPAAAPTEFADAAALEFPERRNFALNFGRNRGRAGAYTGPDGGSVYQWQAEFYAWDLKTGARFLQYPNGTWVLEDKSKGHQIAQYQETGAQKAGGSGTFPTARRSASRRIRGPGPPNTTMRVSATAAANRSKSPRRTRSCIH